MKSIIVFLILCFLPSFGAAYEVAAVRDGAEKLTGEIRATGEDGEVLWTVSHHSIATNAPFHGPILHRGVWIYALGGDLLELSAEGKVFRRTPYPTAIGGLRSDGDLLWVTLYADEGFNTEVLHTGRVVDGGPWTRFTWAALRLRRDVPEGLRVADVPNDTWVSLQPELLVLENTDLTNPLLSVYLGAAYLKKNDTKRAHQAFERARERSILWSDSFMVCGAMEMVGEFQLAELACAEASQKQIAAGIRPEAMVSVVLLAGTAIDLNIAMEAAILAKDTGKADRIAGYVHTLFPNMEGSDSVWFALAEWFGEQGDSANAEKWRTRASQSASHPITKSQFGQTRLIDLSLLFMGSAGFAILLAGLAFGVSSFRRRPEGEGWRRVFCPPTAAESVSVIVLILTIMWVGVQASRGVAQVADFATTPLAAFNDGLGSPDVIAWLEKSPESPRKTEFLTYARQDLEATKNGEESLLKPPSLQEFVALMDERSREKPGNPLALFQLASMAAGDQNSGTSPFPFLLFLGMFPGFLIFGSVGRLMARQVGRPQHRLFSIIPGIFAGPLAGWVATSVIAGLLYMFTPFGAILHYIATPDFARFYGLKGLELAHAARPDLNLILVAFTAGLTVHIFTTRRALSSPTETN